LGLFLGKVQWGEEGGGREKGRTERGRGRTSSKFAGGPTGSGACALEGCVLAHMTIWSFSIAGNFPVLKAVAKYFVMSSHPASVTAVNILKANIMRRMDGPTSMIQPIHPRLAIRLTSLDRPNVM